MFAGGSLGVRCIWWLLQCSHLMVPLCIVVCPVGARLTAVCGAALCPVALLLAFLLILGSFFFCWHAHPPLPTCQPQSVECQPPFVLPPMTSGRPQWKTEKKHPIPKRQP